jgi:hypothetical protein
MHDLCFFVMHAVLQAMDKKKSNTGTVGSSSSSSSSKEAGEAAGNTGGRTRRSSTAIDDATLAAESSAVQLNAELLPHFLIEVRGSQWHACVVRHILHLAELPTGDALCGSATLCWLASVHDQCAE